MRELTDLLPETIGGILFFFFFLYFSTSEFYTVQYIYSGKFKVHSNSVNITMAKHALDNFDQWLCEIQT